MATTQDMGCQYCPTPQRYTPETRWRLRFGPCIHPFAMCGLRCPPDPLPCYFILNAEPNITHATDVDDPAAVLNQYLQRSIRRQKLRTLSSLPSRNFVLPGTEGTADGSFSRGTLCLSFDQLDLSPEASSSSSPKRQNAI